MRWVSAFQIDYNEVFIYLFYIESSIAKEFLENWGLKLDTELVTTIGRKIPPPALSFYENSEPRIVEPNFSKEASKSCVHPVSNQNAIIVVFSSLIFKFL